MIQILLHLFQSLLMTIVGYGLIGIKVNKKEVVSIAILNTINISIIRFLYKTFNVHFGTHTVIISAVYSVICLIILREGILNVFIATLISFSIILLQELTILLPLVYLIDIVDLSRLIKVKSLKYFFIGIILNLPLIILSLLCNFKNISIINLNKGKE